MTIRKAGYTGSALFYGLHVKRLASKTLVNTESQLLGNVFYVDCYNHVGLSTTHGFLNCETESVNVAQST